ncbi:MAG: hypothetical protein NVS3B3_18720 [Aquirhabdus sp.]
MSIVNPTNLDFVRFKTKDELTLRDYFAASALPELLAQYYNDPSFSVAPRAYAIADEMIKVRNGS